MNSISNCGLITKKVNMSFKIFIQENHPDPDSVFGIDNYDFEQIVVLAENFAKEESAKQLPIERVSNRRELLIAYEKEHYTPQEWLLVEKQYLDEIDRFLSV